MGGESRRLWSFVPVMAGTNVHNLVAEQHVLFRIGIEGDRDRDREDAARDYFAEHGHWPGE